MLPAIRTTLDIMFLVSLEAATLIGITVAYEKTREAIDRLHRPNTASPRELKVMERFLLIVPLLLLGISAIHHGWIIVSTKI